MPVYEFRCKDCDRIFQELFSSYEINPDTVECPACKTHHAEKILSVFAADTKGTQEASSIGPCGAHCACHPN